MIILSDNKTAWISTIALSWIAIDIGILKKPPPKRGQTPITQVIRIDGTGRLCHVTEVMQTVARETVICSSKVDNLIYSATSPAFIDSAISAPTRRPLVKA